MKKILAQKINNVFEDAQQIGIYQKYIKFFQDNYHTIISEKWKLCISIVKRKKLIQRILIYLSTAREDYLVQLQLITKQFLQYFIIHDTYFTQQIYEKELQLIRRLINNLQTLILKHNTNKYSQINSRNNLRKSASCLNFKRKSECKTNTVSIDNNQDKINYLISLIQKNKENVSCELRYYFDMYTKVKSLLECNSKLKSLKTVLKKTCQEKYFLSRKLVDLKFLLDVNNPQNSQNAEKKYLLSEPLLSSILRRKRSQQLLLEFHRRQCSKMLNSFQLIQQSQEKYKQVNTLNRKRPKSR